MTAEIELLPLVGTLRALPEHVQGVVQAYARANVAHATAALQAEIEALRAEVVKLSNLRADAIHECALANVRAERLAEALRDAATSMQTIADKAGRDEYLMTTDEVRGYANSRANAARAALSKENSND